MTAFEKDVIERLARIETHSKTHSDSLADMHVNGCAKGHVDRADIYALKEDRPRMWKAINSKGGDSIGNMLGYGKLKTVGLPSIIIAVALGIAAVLWATNRVANEAKTVALELKGNEDRQVALIKKQVKDSVATIISEVKDLSPVRETIMVTP